MKTDGILHIIISAVFRFGIYLLAVVCIDNHSNFFSNEYYIFAMFLHLAIYFSTRTNKSKWAPQVRLANDYGFIVFVLYGKSLADILNYSLFILPVLNSANFTGRYSLFSSLSLYVVAILGAYIINRELFSILITIPMSVFWLINSLTKIREHENQLQLVLVDSISDYNELAVYSNKRKALSDIKDKINNDSIYSFFSSSKIEAIACFKINQSETKLISSSELNFDGTLRLSSTAKVQSSHIERKSMIFKRFGKRIEPHKILPITTFVDDNKYLFLIIFNEYATINKTYTKLFYSVFNKLTRSIDVEFEINKKNRGLRVEINNKATFINNAVTNTHFINNQLGPIKTYLSILDIIDSGKNRYANSQLKVKAEEERKKAENSLRLIVQRNKTLLEKANNPLEYVRKREITAEDLIQIIKFNLSNLLLIDEVFITTPLEIHLSGKISINTDVFENVIDEISNNIKKHCNDEGTYSCTIDVNEKLLTVYFMNKIKPNRYDSTKEVIDTFLDNPESEALSRYGLSIIYKNCKIMGISPEIGLDDSIFHISLSFPIL